ncbi:FKBP-type peptidyl-prolyl cis-trans isomerase [Sphaerotilus sp.]|uniref:FKBP-type peptidyl-prolyl cis-trans isomerase n=1 Tax=Sphaerotilus sp. TaxID=2093942 RepID=UPI0025EE924D|nr:FKBP-type peptidyl-prolyl cis-trans isomerase [Sphaerotilus sp.]
MKTVRQLGSLGSLGMVLFGLSGCAQTGGPAAAPVAADTVAPATAQQKLSYALGVQTVRNLIRSDVAFDVAQIVQGLRDAAAGERTALPEKELKLAVASMQADVQRKLAADRVGLAARNRQRGETFMADYRRRSGVQVLPSQVLLRELQAGRGGAQPREDGLVRVAYRGTLIDGSEFDATEAGKSTALDVTQLIPGWREALRHMTPGARYEVVVPPHMGYGERGVGGTVGPNETLVFTVELIDILR